MKGLSRRDWVILSSLILVLGIFFTFGPKNFPGNNNGPAPEIEKIISLTNTTEQSEELLKLLDRVGPVEAQEEMFHSGMPFTGQTHLLIHTIGDYVYEHYGLDGLSLCREYFLSACYHGFIINALADHGIEGVATAIDKCTETGGNIVAVQCAHAAGHGFVAWQDYNLIKALGMCDELGGKVENFGYFNCYDGVFMENIWGVHNGAPSEKRWIKSDDIYYPCNDPRIPEKYLGGCWANQATLIYQHYHGDLRKTALACDAVENPAYQSSCYNNLARQIHPLTEGSVDKVLTLCANATGEKWQNDCILTNMSSYWGVGDRQIPFDLCSALTEPLRGACFDRLANMIGYYYGKNPDEKEMYCDKITDEQYKNKCLSNN